MNFKKKLISALTFLTVAASSTAVLAGNTLTASAVDMNNDDWLHASGSRLYDESGNEVWLTGANWFGFNCTENCPHYLWSADIDDCLREIADHGINIIRFPVSSELLISWMNGKPNAVSSLSANNNPYYSINADFCNPNGSIKNSMEVFDIIIDKMKSYGLKAFVDVHSPDSNNTGHNYNLWYGKKTTGGTTVTTDLWIKSLTWLANKYKNDDTILAYDLKNEPHGTGQEGSSAAKWDNSNDENNWKNAATKCANSILKVNPNALILIEGVEQTTKSSSDKWGNSNAQYNSAWWGGNLRGVKNYPVKPTSGTSQIVYSPHDYGPSVYEQSWFQKNFTTKTLLDDYWYDTWAYINKENIAPLLIGEWGGYMDGGRNQKWMTLLRDYMIDNHISHTFWCLNTNSGDTGGLWQSLEFSGSSGTKIVWDKSKYNLFEPSLWQTKKTGKYIGLDHIIPLGSKGITVEKYYKTYASSEGSNLDSNGSKNPKQPVITASSSGSYKLGDANQDGKVDIRDAAYIARMIANGYGSSLPSSANYNKDKVANIRDAAALARDIAKGKKF